MSFCLNSDVFSPLLRYTALQMLMTWSRIRHFRSFYFCLFELQENWLILRRLCHQQWFSTNNIFIAFVTCKKLCRIIHTPQRHVFLTHTDHSDYKTPNCSPVVLQQSLSLIVCNIQYLESNCTSQNVNDESIHATVLYQLKRDLLQALGIPFKIFKIVQLNIIALTVVRS